MITEPNEFMQRLQELQDSSSVTYSTLPSNEPRFIIDANSRTIKIPPEFQFLGVKNDHKAETVYFEIDRYFDNEDLSTHTCVIQFENKSGEGSIYPVTIVDTESIDGKIIFGWEILSDATTIVGDIIFSVRFYSLDNYVFTYNFNTLPAKSVILDTLNVDDPTILENYPSELEAWLDRMNDLSQNVVKPEDVELLDTKMDTLETSFGELETNVNSSVDELRGDLSHINKTVLHDLSTSIFKNENINENKVIDVNSGELVYQSDVSTTDFIDVSFYSRISLSLPRYSEDHIIALYDIDKNLIYGYVFTWQSEKYELDIPSDCFYIRISVYPTELNTLTIYAELNKTDMLFDSVFNTVSNGFYVDEHGNLLPNSDVSTTNYLCVENCDYIEFAAKYSIPHNDIHNIAFYNRNRTFNSFFSTNYYYNEEHLIVSVPNDAVYVRVSFYNDTANSVMVKGKKSENYSEYKMNCLGDSITFGYIPDNGERMTNPYPYIIKNKLGFEECRNYGISGSTLTDRDNGMSVRYLDMDNDANIICVFGGTNDYGNFDSVQLGDKDSTDKMTINGALNVLINGLINKYPKATIFFITPLKRADIGVETSQGLTLEKVANAIKERCNYYSIPVLDLYNTSGFHIENDGFRNLYGGNDKLHPSQRFIDEHLSKQICAFIKTLIN